MTRNLNQEMRTRKRNKIKVEGETAEVWGGAIKNQQRKAKWDKKK